MKPNGFKLEMEILSLLHIGDGSTLIPLEYVVSDGLVKVANLDFLIEALSDRIASQLGEEMMSLSDFLRDKNQAHLLQRPELYSREMRLVGGAGPQLMKDLNSRDKKQINKAQIKTFVKTLGKPFIPGSSIKGAVRTALAYNILKKAGGGKAEKILNASVKAGRDREGRIKSFPSERDAVEKYLLRDGDGIDKDVMALMGFTDSEPLDHRNLVVVKGKRINGPPTSYYECLPHGLKTTFVVFFNEFGNEKEGTLRRPNANLIPTTPQELFGILNGFARDLIAFERRQNANMRERDFSGKHNQDLERIINFYNALEAKMDQHPDAGFMVLGWGTGWHGKTVGLLLKDYPGFKDAMYAYRMGGRRKEPSAFPVSREVILGSNIEPVFGWVMLRLKED